MDDPTLHPPPLSGVLPAQQDLSGTLLGEYRVLSLIGRGGMGEVYLAEQVSLGRRVAVKVMRPEFTANPLALRRFQAEARAVARLMHPNIVQVFTIGEQAGVHYIALEYVEGSSLADHMRKAGPLPWSWTAAVLRQVAAALHHASEHGIVHRDIKPENILLTSRLEAKVADFGLARCMTADAAGENLTSTGVVMGTPRYMSPEQIESRPTDARSDIYSLGITVYHMLAGIPPYVGATPFEVASKHVTGSFIPLREIRRDIPEGFAAIVHRMMARRSGDRHANGQELLDALDRLPEPGPGAVPLSRATLAKLEPSRATSDEVTLSPEGLSALSGGRPGAASHAPGRWRRWIAIAMCALGATALFTDLPPRIRGSLAILRAPVAHPIFGGRIPPEGLVLEFAQRMEAVTFSPDGKYLATGELEYVEEGSVVAVYDCTTGKPVLRRGPGEVRSLAFSPDSRLLAVGSSSSSGSIPAIRLIDMKDPAFPERHLAPGTEHNGVRTVTFDPDGKRLAVAVSRKDDTTDVRLWDLVSGSEGPALATHTSTFYGLAFSPDGRILASGSGPGMDQLIKLHDPATGERVREDIRIEGDDGVTDLVFTPDGTKLVVGCYGSVTLQQVPNWDTLGTVGEGGAHSLAVSRNGLLAIGTEAGEILIRDLATRALRRTLRGHKQQVQGVAFSPDGRMLASASWDMTVRLWDLNPELDVSSSGPSPSPPGTR